MKVFAILFGLVAIAAASPVGNPNFEDADAQEQAIKAVRSVIGHF
jgi:hypothetical protein